MDLASGIAGLIGLAGLAVQSTSTLYIFCRKMPRVADDIEAIISEIRRFLETLETLQHAVIHRAVQNPSPRTSVIVAKLLEELKQCMVDLEAWNSSMTALKMRDGKGIENTTKKLKLVADAGRFLETKVNISSHRNQLVLLMELLNVDLGISTSLDVQGLDSKIDEFVTEQVMSQRKNACHLESIQDGVQAVATLQNTSREATVDISRLTERIRETLQDIQISQATSQQLSIQQGEKLDKTLAAIQYSLMAISTKGQRGLRTRHKTRKMKSHRLVIPGVGLEERSSSTSSLETVQGLVGLSTNLFQINQLVDLAITVRYQRGKAQFNAIAVPDQAFDTADRLTKLRMVKYLQDLRLLLWLLRRDTYATNGLSAFHKLNNSSYYVSEMGLIPSNQALESLSIFLLPKYLCGHFTEANVELFVTNKAIAWGRFLISVRLYWGYNDPIGVEVVTLERSKSEMGFYRRGSPPLGIPATTDEMQPEFSWHVQNIVHNNILGYVPAAYVDQESDLSKRLLQAVCSFYNTTREKDNESELLRRALETHVTAVILERSLSLDDESRHQVQQLLNEEYPEGSAPRCAQRQIKLAFYFLQEKRTPRVLEDWGNMIQSSSIQTSESNHWAVTFNVFVVIVLVIDKILGSAWYFCEGNIKHRRHEAISERREFLNLVELVEKELFERCKEVFHWRFKTRKGGREACNPIRDGIEAFQSKSKSAFIDDSVKNLVRDFQAIIRNFEREVRLHRSDQNSYSKYTDAGRLACIFLDDFLSLGSSTPGLPPTATAPI